MFQALIIFGNRGPVLRLHPQSETGASTPPGKAGELAAAISAPPERKSVRCVILYRFGKN
jgi:hypothetical protein